MARIRNVSIKIDAEAPISLNVTQDLMQTQLYNLNGGGLGTVRDLLFAKWNDGELPVQPGTYERVDFIGSSVRVYSLGAYVTAKVLATIEVGETRYLGSFTEQQVAVLDGSSEIEVEMPDIPNAWEEIAEDAPDPKVQAEFTSVMQY
jgi:hypothetical protein